MAEDVAREYWRVNSWKRLLTAQRLVADINEYMASKGLEKSSINRYDVAEYVLELQHAQTAEADLRPVATPEQTAWANDQSQGIGDRLPDGVAFRQADERLLAAQVRAMSMPEFAAN